MFFYWCHLLYIYVTIVKEDLLPAFSSSSFSLETGVRLKQLRNLRQ